MKTTESGAPSPLAWIHAASLGEYEQAVPVIQELRERGYQIAVSFYSPSGFRQKSKDKLLDFVTYLPLDTPGNAKRFVELLQPDLALFVKYDFWVNFLEALHRSKVPTAFLSSTFRDGMAFDKITGSWMLSTLRKVDWFFVQDEHSIQKLNSWGITQCSVSGDTRFDRSASIYERDNTLDWLARWKDDDLLLVIGSSWPADEAVYIPVLKQLMREHHNLKLLIAPHEIHADQVDALVKELTQTQSYSHSVQAGKPIHAATRAIVMDTIGLLTRAYSYADIAYVGGAMGNTGLHNILEPATFGVPVIIGKHYEKFPEAAQLRQLGGLFSVSSETDLRDTLEPLITNDTYRQQTGMIAGHWINSNTGATGIVMEWVDSLQ